MRLGRAKSDIHETRLERGRGPHHENLIRRGARDSLGERARCARYFWGTYAREINREANTVERRAQAQPVLSILSSIQVLTVLAVTQAARHGRGVDLPKQSEGDTPRLSTSPILPRRQACRPTSCSVSGRGNALNNKLNPLD